MDREDGSKMSDLKSSEDSDNNSEERRSSVNLRYTKSALEVDMANGKVMGIPHASIKQQQQQQINITEVRYV